MHTSAIVGGIFGVTVKLISNAALHVPKQRGNTVVLALKNNFL